MQISKLILVFLFTLFSFSGCANRVTKDAAPTLSEFTKVSGVGDSFGFLDSGHKYVFVFHRPMTEDYYCDLLSGYRDGELAYQLKGTDIRELQKIYEAKITIDLKIKRALEFVQAHNRFPMKCSAETGVRLGKMSLSDKLTGGTMVIFFAPLIPIAMMIAPDVWADPMWDSLLDKSLNKIELGMTRDEVKKEINKSMTEFREGSYTLDQYIVRQRNLVFVYGKNKLVAYVWGSAPVYKNQK